MCVAKMCVNCMSGCACTAVAEMLSVSIDIFMFWPKTKFLVNINFYKQ